MWLKRHPRVNALVAWKAASVLGIRCLGTSHPAMFFQPHYSGKDT